MMFLNQAAPSIFEFHPKKETPAEYRQRKEREKANRPTDPSTFGLSDKNMAALQKLKDQFSNK